MDYDAEGRGARPRRVPQQSRSRARVERILDSAAEHVVTSGVETLSTRAIAECAGVPVASLYQYFADKDDILLALVERDIRAMDDEVNASLAALPCLTIASIVETTMAAFVRVYRQRPAFVMIWLRGRTNATIKQYCRDHNRRLGDDLYKIADDLGLFGPQADPCYAELAVEMGDRLFQIAFENDLEGDEMVLEEAVKVVTAYLELYASDLGLRGVATAARADAAH
jgi:AcrR family transcriptional regulator